LSKGGAGCEPPLNGDCPMGDVADCKSERGDDVNGSGVVPKSGNKPDGGRGICTESARRGNESATCCPFESGVDGGKTPGGSVT
jgi:hypothetical protein